MTVGIREALNPGHHPDAAIIKTHAHLEVLYCSMHAHLVVTHCSIVVTVPHH
jgi:hypothetical protein